MVGEEEIPDTEGSRRAGAGIGMELTCSGGAG